MSSLITNATIQIRQDTAGNWTSTNPTPAAGEWCKEIDTKKTKNGDGSTAWNDLEYETETGLVESVAQNTSDIADKPTGVEEQLCKAWVNFDGTQSGTITPIDSFNVTNITKVSTGRYDVNITTALNNTNYTVTISTNNKATVRKDIVGTTSSFRVQSYGLDNATLIDTSSIFIQVFGS